MNDALIPRYDMLGLPIPAWIAQALTALTLALHWALLGAALGGTVAVVLSRLALRGEAGSALRKAVVPALPMCLSLAMTAGVAPLLFVQVLYGNFFYAANILHGWWWLGLLAALIAIFYLMYNAWRQAAGGGPVGAASPALAAGLMILAAAILVGNATLTQNPGAWESLRGEGGRTLYTADATFRARLALAATGLLAGGGIFVAALARIRLGGSPGGVLGVRIGSVLAAAGVIGQVAAGALLWKALPGKVFDAAVSGGESAFFYVASTLTVLTLPAVLLAWRARSAGAFAAAGGVYFVALLGVAGVRDAIRRAALGGRADLGAVPVHPQWDSFAAFLVVLVLGLGVIAWLVKLARTRPAGTS